MPKPCLSHRVWLESCPTCNPPVNSNNVGVGVIPWERNDAAIVVRGEYEPLCRNEIVFLREHLPREAAWLVRRGPDVLKVSTEHLARWVDPNSNIVGVDSPTTPPCPRCLGTKKWKPASGCHLQDCPDCKPNSNIVGVEARPDMVDHPPHYTSHPSGVECIAIAEHFGFRLGNVIKYCWRAYEKGSALEDLKKARWYLDREIQAREKEAGNRSEK